MVLKCASLLLAWVSDLSIASLEAEVRIILKESSSQ